MLQTGTIIVRGHRLRTLLSLLASFFHLPTSWNRSFATSCDFSCSFFLLSYNSSIYSSLIISKQDAIVTEKQLLNWISQSWASILPFMLLVNKQRQKAQAWISLIVILHNYFLTVNEVHNLSYRICLKLLLICFVPFVSYRYCKNKPYPKSRFCRGVPGNELFAVALCCLCKKFLKNYVLPLCRSQNKDLWFGAQEGTCRWPATLCSHGVWWVWTAVKWSPWGSPYLLQQVHGEALWERFFPSPYATPSFPCYQD